MSEIGGIRGMSVKAMLRRFMPSERRDMTGGNGMIGVGCEFCSTYCAFDPADSGLGL